MTIVGHQEERPMHIYYLEGVNDFYICVTASAILSSGTDVMGDTAVHCAYKCICSGVPFQYDSSVLCISDSCECTHVCYPLHLQCAPCVSCLLAHLFHRGCSVLRWQVLQMCGWGRKPAAPKCEFTNAHKFITTATNTCHISQFTFSQPISLPSSLILCCV